MNYYFHYKKNTLHKYVSSSRPEIHNQISSRNIRKKKPASVEIFLLSAHQSKRLPQKEYVYLYD